MQYLSFWHLARIQLEESDPARRKFNRNLVKRSKEVDCYQYSGITSNFYGNELSILEHSCYTSDTTDRRQATGITKKNGLRGLCNFKLELSLKIIANMIYLDKRILFLLTKFLRVLL